MNPFYAFVLCFSYQELLSEMSEKDCMAVFLIWRLVLSAYHFGDVVLG